MATIDFSPTGTRSRVVIFPPMVSSLFFAGGDVREWMGIVGRENLWSAVREAPRRTGHLASMHNLSFPPHGRYNVFYAVGNYAEYAPWVSNGTDGPIQAGMWDDGKHAYLGPMAPWMGRNTLYAFQVRGQEANDWLTLSRNLTLARYAV